LVGIGGLLAIWWERRRFRRDPTSGRVSGIFRTWAFFAFLSMLLTLAALIYTFIVTYNTNDQHIDISLAASVSPKPYPLNNWTPENWFDAVLAQPLAESSDRSKIRTNLRLMRAWRWNLIPLLLFGIVVVILAARLALPGVRKSRRNRVSGSSYENGKRGF